MAKELQYEYVIYGWQIGDHGDPKPTLQIQNNPLLLSGPGSLWSVEKPIDGIPELLRLCPTAEDFEHSVLGRKIYFACHNDVLMFLGDTRVHANKRFHKFMFVASQKNDNVPTFGWAEEESCCKFLVVLEE